MRPQPDVSLESIHRLIVEGRGAEARPLLAASRDAGIARAEAPRFAWLSWRVGLPELGLATLAPYLRENGRRAVVSTPAERAEQAQCLTRLGAPSEALSILATVDASAYARAHLYSAAARIARWEYAAALPFLEAYLASTRQGSYERLVAQVNLAAALLYEGELAACRLALRRLALETSLRKAPVLHANALEIEAQRLVEAGRYGEARPAIQRAARELARSGMNDQAYTRKWEAIVTMRMARSADEARACHATARAEAMAHGSWESARQLDRELSLQLRDPALAREVYIGTPFPAYREKLARAWDAPLAPEGSWIRKLGEPDSASTPALDLETGAYGPARLKAGNVLHRLLYAVSVDAYRPQTAAALFAAMHPGEIYHPEYGRRRVHQTLFRLRGWMDASGLPVAIEEQNGFYRLVGRPACLVAIPLEAPWAERDGRIEIARRALADLGRRGPFSSAEASVVLGASHRTTLRLLAEGLAEGWLERDGARKGARYRLAAPSRGEAA